MLRSPSKERLITIGTKGIKDSDSDNQKPVISDYGSVFVKIESGNIGTLIERMLIGFKICVKNTLSKTVDRPKGKACFC
jgi:hypothetical protein